MRTYKYSHEMHERFLLIRKAMNKTQEQMARGIGYSDAYYGKLERPGSYIGENVVIAMCSVYSVSYDYLVNGTGPMFNEMDAQQRRLNKAFDELVPSLRDLLVGYIENLITFQEDHIVERKDHD